MAEKTSEGTRRLSLVLGGLGLVAWAVVAVSFFVEVMPSLSESPEVIRQTSEAGGDLKELTTHQKRRVVENIQEHPELRESLLKDLAGRGYDTRDVESYADSVFHSETRSKFYSVIMLLLVVAPFSFLVPWGGVRLIAWVVAGFREKG